MKLLPTEIIGGCVFLTSLIVQRSCFMETPKFFFLHAFGLDALFAELDAGYAIGLIIISFSPQYPKNCTIGQNSVLMCSVAALLSPSTNTILFPLPLPPLPELQWVLQIPRVFATNQSYSPLLPWPVRPCALHAGGGAPSSRLFGP